MSSPRATALSVLGVAVGACAHPEPFREGVRTIDGLYPGAATDADHLVVTRLVDDLTGTPVVGAEVFLVDESSTPIAGEFWFSSRATSDGEGFVRITLPPGARGTGWQVVRHPSCGVAMRSDPSPVWRLGRPFDVPVRITDWLGRPAAGARIGFCGGCGHTPDLVNATADANGIAVLRGIDPRNDIADLYVQHPGLHFFYDSVDWLPGGAPMAVRCDHAPALTGTVVDHRGIPVAGAFVCGGSNHRGPWARTAANGSFAVLGAEPPTYPHQVVTPGGRKVYFDTSTAWPVTLHLPDLADPDAHEGIVEQRAVAPEPVVLRQVRVAVDGAPGKVESVTFVPDRHDQREAAAGHALVPARGPFLLVVSAAEAEGSRSFPFADGGLVPDPLVVRWDPDARLVGSAVDAAGQPVAANVRIRRRWSWSDQGDADETAPQPFPGGAFDLACPRTGVVLLEIAPLAAGARPRLLWVDVPRDGHDRIDLGQVVVGGPPQLRIVDARGAPLPSASVAFARAGWQEAGNSYCWPIAADGSWQGPDLRPGDTIVVQADQECLPSRTVLHGAGPWTMAPAAGQLDLRIVDPAGHGLVAVVVCGDQDVDAEAGDVRLRGLRPGPQRLYVSAEGYRSALVDMIVGAAPQQVRVELPAR